MKRLAVMFAAITLLISCGTKPPRDVVDTVCFDAQGFDEHAARLARKAAQTYLEDYTLRLVQTGCDAEVRLVRLNTLSTTHRNRILGPFTSASTYASMDGTVSIRVRGSVLADDAAVQSSQYTAMLDTINSLVWQALKPVIKGYRRSTEPL